MTEVGQSSFYSKICFYQYLVHKYEGTTMKIQKKSGAQPHNSEKKNEETLVIKKSKWLGPLVVMAAIPTIYNIL